jgi:FkbM family methyltransferase
MNTRARGLALTFLAVGWIAFVVWLVMFRQRVHKSLPFDIPGGVTHVIVDCGTFQKSHFFDLLDDDPTLLLIGIEPQPKRRALHPKHPRFIHLPYAAGSETRTSVTFHLWSDTGASTKELGAFHANALGGPGRTFETIRVPMVRLDDLLDALELPIDVLKTDVQGADLDVLRGAQKLLLRTPPAQAGSVKVVVAECQDIPGEDDPRLYYKGGCKTHELVPYMQVSGLPHHECKLQNYEIQEVNCYFARTPDELQEALAKIRV